MLRTQPYIINCFFGRYVFVNEHVLLANVRKPLILQFYNSQFRITTTPQVEQTSYLCQMIQSMTGYGKAEGQVMQQTVTVEIRSVNSKSFDMNIKTPPLFRTQESEIRKQLSERIARGKVDVYVNLDRVEQHGDVELNHALIDKYYQEIKKVEYRLNTPVQDYMSLILRMPDVYRQSENVPNEEALQQLNDLVKQACDKFTEFRMQEGAALEFDLRTRIELIATHLSQVMAHEPERALTVRERIGKNLAELKDAVDQTRLEQEMIYYLEKLDVTEEKVRLTNHCKYFLDTMAKEEQPGRKLSFISQEIGREINTIGSKANHFEIQKLVVQMKDELEKIKEQLLNVL